MDKLFFKILTMLTAQQAKEIAKKYVYVPPTSEKLGLVLQGIEYRAKQGQTSWSIPYGGLYPVAAEIKIELKKLGYGAEYESQSFEEDSEEFLEVTW